MAEVLVRFNSASGKMKPMHAVNNGPIRGKFRGNFDYYKAAKIPYTRTHDASFESAYGGEHSVDIQAVFPDFTKNPYNPDSYDFTLTDRYLNLIVEAGASVFYRLGTKIEHWPKRYGTIVPEDFHKWAVVCEHIIKHYNDGWANGFHHNIIYWEIWNEPDGAPNWTGTSEQFYEFYEVAATHLKKRFPHLKIGGPAVAGERDWIEGFFRHLTSDGKRVPLDFFSWHIYNVFPESVRVDGDKMRALLDEAGYTETESILDEYNCVIDFGENYTESIEDVIGIHGAAYTAACMAVGQASDVDMLMYYDARPCILNGMFDYYTFRPLKGYYPFVMFSKLYDLENSVECTSDNEHIYAVAASNGEKKCVMISHYRWDKSKCNEKVEIVLGGTADGEWTAEFLDEKRTMEKQTVLTDNGKLTLNMQEDCIVLLTKDI